MRIRPARLMTAVALALPLTVSGCVSFGTPEPETAADPVQETDMVHGEFRYAVPEDSPTDPRDWVTPFEVGASVVQTPSQDEGMKALSVTVRDVPAETFSDVVMSATQGTVNLNFEDGGGGSTVLDGQADLTAVPGAEFTLTLDLPGTVADASSSDYSGTRVSWMVEGGHDDRLWAQTESEDGPRSAFWWVMALSLAGAVTAGAVMVGVRVGWLS